jgi:hypothetical protein
VTAIFLRYGDTFVAMREQRYEAESVLQALIAEHPEILGEDEEGAPSEWLLVKQEAGIADVAEGPERWSLDHLFLDRAGVPTLVEVKRSTDTRLRREVVAQMLEYAANGVAYWSADLLRTWFEAECERQQVVPERRLEAFGVTDLDTYWQLVKTNLDAERIRLVFVADEVPRELRSILEYLNRQMTQTEVFAIEVRQYLDADGERQTIVPRVVGRTEAARAAKSGAGRAKRQWDEQSLLDDIDARSGAAAVATVRDLLGWAANRGLIVRYGSGAHYATAQIRLKYKGRAVPILFIQSGWTIYIYFSHLSSMPPFDQRAERDDLRAGLANALPAATIASEDDKLEPTVPFDAIAAPEARAAFTALIESALARVASADNDIEATT